VPVYQKLNVHGVGMAGGNGHDQGLIQAMDLLFGPAVGGNEVCKHKNSKNQCPDNYIIGQAHEQTLQNNFTQV